MPYIAVESRKLLDPVLNRVLNLVGPMAEIGVVNYCITRLASNWLGPDPNYERFNAAIGVLESAKLELYRRGVAPYEDAKIRQNGDVYEER